MKLFFVFLAIIITGIAYSQNEPEKDIRQVLADQTLYWNKGDIEHFMQTYWKSDSLVFIGKNGVTYGWQNTLDNYRKGYPDQAAMGKLQFTIIKIEKLSTDCYNVIGKWHLTRTIGDLQGHFTLLFRKMDKKWLIVQDHSS